MPVEGAAIGKSKEEEGGRRWKKTRKPKEKKEEKERERERDLGEKETYITACAVRTFVEEFGRRLRSP